MTSSHMCVCVASDSEQKERKKENENEMKLKRIKAFASQFITLMSVIYLQQLRKVKKKT
jgi:hypothetical protein